MAAKTTQVVQQVAAPVTEEVTEQFINGAASGYATRQTINTVTDTIADTANSIIDVTKGFLTGFFSSPDDAPKAKSDPATLPPHLQYLVAKK